MNVAIAKVEPSSNAKAHQPAPGRPAAPAGVEQGAGADGTVAPDNAVAIQAGTRSGIEHAVTTGEQMMTFGRANAAAVMESSRIWFAGCHALSHEITAITQAAFGRNLGLLSSFSAVRTHQDAVTLHASSVNGMMDRAARDVATLTETSMKLAGQAFAPLAARIDEAVSRASASRG